MLKPMLSQSNLEKIKKITEEFFNKIAFPVEIIFLPQKDQIIPIDLKTENPQILIGEGGQTLNEIQHILKRVIRAVLKREGDEAKASSSPFANARVIDEPFYIDLDINDYKKKKNQYLKELAFSLADEVVLTKEEKTLAPMPAYERRIIHLALAERHDVSAESIGQGPERRVVVKPHL